MEFSTKRLPAVRDVVAPDGTDARILLELKGGGLTPDVDLAGPL